MSNKKRWLALALITGAAVGFVWQRWRDLGHVIENFRRYGMPNAALYDASAASVLGPFYEKVAGEMAGMVAHARVLEIGSGTGRLAIKLARSAPDVQITGLDIAPDMVDRANSLAARSGLADRVIFQAGDVASLPFPDASFDLVTSTLSLHHWADPVKGLAEIHRVLRPDGTARIYDVMRWISRFEGQKVGIAGLVKSSPFAKNGSFKRSILFRLGPIPIVFRAELRKGRIAE